MAPRIAIVHDWIVSMRGGERVLESLCRLYPRAPVFTLRYERRAVSATIAAQDVRTAFTDLLRPIPPARLGRLPDVAAALSRRRSNRCPSPSST